MPRKPRKTEEKPEMQPNAHILGAGEVVEQDITETLETNYMPYAMSVILSRAIPEIDGFKPSHRKLLYTMYKMGLLSGGTIKSANIVGRTMQLNPHGDGPIYETMVRLTRGNEALLHPYIQSKGNFGKAYSRNMQYAASRYTEAKLEPIAAELFADIDKDTVDFVDNYDSTMKEPTLFPVTFPSVLVNANTGIAVGMASSICSFNLREVCEATQALVKDADFDVSEILRAPDFVGGGQIVYDEAQMQEIFRTGRGSFKVRSKYTVDKSNHCIDVTQIPPTTTAEAIIEKIVEKVKSGAAREIADVRDETDKKGLKITIDYKRGADPDKLMKKLFRMTPLEDSFACNFNVLIAGVPRVLGVRDLLLEWIAFRSECVRRRTYFELARAKERLHLLEGLQKILLDIDKAIRIIRSTDEEAEVVPNLMIGFGIDKTQAEYVAEIKLRHLNREYILKRTADIAELREQIADMEDILQSRARVKRILVSELQAVAEKYAIPRRSEIVYAEADDDEDEAEEIPDYPVHLFFTKGGYFKKITPQSLRMSGEQKLKEGDSLLLSMEATNSTDLLFFTDRCQVYKAKAADFEDTKASALGDYVPTKLHMDPGEAAVYMAVTTDYRGYMLFFFENGRLAKVDLSAYATKTNRKKLIKAYCEKFPVAAMLQIEVDRELVVQSSSGRLLLLNTGAVAPKTTKDTQGVVVMTLKKGHRVALVRDYREGEFQKPARYRTRTLPAAGALLSAEDTGEQLTL
ncbi:MAG TPA: topoisomerase IV [Candidatus Fimenecus excrementigallinarum]|uniref:Topoisomerase IV n=1 Tax=Candidatus Fimenecus excrementigallinarum TaxID=2840816 RepID=A0A9D1LDM2_9FIRM|nr:topoisomerase IV [Candidatus Fimenecus excrementigallinarum]